MSWLDKIFGRKKESHVDAGRVQRSIETRYNPMRQLTPANLSRWIDEFEAGELRPLARLLEAVSQRDDSFKTGLRKTTRSVARCDYEIRFEEGAEEDPDAKDHRDVLVDFWRSVRATELLNQSAVGGISRLVRQMMLAERDCHNVHELLWRVDRGKLRLTAVHVPLWMFELKTGHIRFLRDNNAAYGEPLVPGEWLVHSGDGVGIACAIAASYKRLTLADWLAYSEHNATPGLHAKTDARQGSPEWQRCVDAVRSFAQEWAIVTGRDVDLGKIDLGASGTLPYQPLVEMMNKAITALWRGSDLSTLSARAEGASLQGEEMDMLEQSAAEDISETLHEQIDRFVIQWHFGVGTEPLARFALVPVSRPDVTKEIAINEHLVRHGAKLSIADECQRFGRRQVDGAEADRAMEAPASPSPGNFGGGLPGIGKSIANELPMVGKKEAELPKLGKEETAFARALQKDLRPVAKALQTALARGEGPGELKRRLEKILRECGAESADVLESAMQEAGKAATEGGGPFDQAELLALANTGTSEGAKKGWATRIRNGWTPKQLQENKDKVAALIADLDKRGPDGKSKAWKNEPQDLGEISQSLADDIRAANPNMRATAGTMQTIDQDQLNHALEEHGEGKEKWPDSIPITKADLARIPDVLSDYDEIVPGRGKTEGKKQEAVVFRKKYEDGTVCCVEIDWFSRGKDRNELKFQTMWKEKPEEEK
jgi:hypothetical protein